MALLEAVQYTFLHSNTCGSLARREFGRKNVWPQNIWNISSNLLSRMEILVRQVDGREEKQRFLKIIPKYRNCREKAVCMENSSLRWNDYMFSYSKISLKGL